MTALAVCITASVAAAIIMMIGAFLRLRDDLEHRTAQLERRLDCRAAQLEEIRPTVTVGERGEITAGTPRVSFRQGLGALLDFAAPPVKITILPPGAPTAIGMLKTGQALREALAAYHNRLGTSPWGN